MLAGAALIALGCGDGGDGGGAAGAAPLPTIGMPCTTACVTGFICERTGPFAGQCTAGCNNGAACQVLAPGTACFGMAPPQCGVMCTTDAQCATGTTCQFVEGMQGCKLAR